MLSLQALSNIPASLSTHNGYNTSRERSSSA